MTFAIQKKPVFLRQILAIGDVSEKLLLILGAVTMAGFVVSTLTDVVFRTLLTPLVWMEEISRLLYMWSILLGSAVAFRRGAHFKIDVFQPKRAAVRRVLNALAYGISCLFVYIILYYGYRFSLMGLTKMSLPSGIPMFYFRMSFPVSGLFMLYYCVEGIVKSVWGVEREFEEDQGVNPR